MTHWAIINFAALTGKIGKPGEGVGFSWHYGCGGMPQSGKGTPAGLLQGKNLVKDICPASRITEMLENPGMTFSYNGIERTYPDIKLIYNAGNNWILANAAEIAAATGLPVSADLETASGRRRRRAPRRSGWPRASAWSLARSRMRPAIHPHRSTTSSLRSTAFGPRQRPPRAGRSF